MVRIPEFDLIVGGAPRFAAEAPWAWRLVRRYARLLPARSVSFLRGRAPLVGDALGRAPIVLVHADPEAYLLPPAALRLVAAIDGSEVDVVIPASNEPWIEQARRAPPFAYHTPSLLAEAVDTLAAAPAPILPIDEASSPVFAIRRGFLEKFPSELPLELVPREATRLHGRAALDPGAYLHRYGEMDAQAREDLARRVPAGARSVLDVGCSRGATAALLREAGVVRIVGIEPDPEDAADAARAYDRVLEGRLEDVSEEFPGEFDAILFGDVLEHLGDPSAALVRVRPWISDRGVVAASLPNVGHWSIIADLLQGRFDYVPYSILSGAHVRLFTRSTAIDLFEACGFEVESVEPVAFPPSPAGSRALEQLRSFPEASEDLTAAEFLIVARPDRTYDPPR